MQDIPCNSALLAQETPFLTQKGTFLPKDLQKVRKSRQILNCDKIAYVQAKSPKFSSGTPRAPAQLLPPWWTVPPPTIIKSWGIKENLFSTRSFIFLDRNSMCHTKILNWKPAKNFYCGHFWSLVAVCHFETWTVCSWQLEGTTQLRFVCWHN